jgi:hypothetical protein
MFVALHRDQVAAIRAELMHARELTAELRGLCKEQCTRPLPPPAPYELTHEVGPTEAVPKFPTAADRPEAAQPPANGTHHADDEAPSLPVPEGVPADTSPDGSIHAWLGKRLAALDAERQGRWQKILDFIRGK